MIYLNVNQAYYNSDDLNGPMMTGRLIQQGRVKLSDALQAVAELLVIPRIVGPHPRGCEQVRIDILDRSKIVIVNFANGIFEVKGAKIVGTPYGLIGAFSYTFTYPTVESWERRAGRYEDPSCVFRLLHDTVEAFAKSDPSICGRQVKSARQLARV